MTQANLNDRAHFASPDRSMYPVLVAAFVGLLLISNIAAVKPIGLFDLPVIGYLVVDGGAFLFPLVYVVGDILSEVYGLKATRRAIYLGFAMAILAAITFWVVQLAPPLDGWENQGAFESVLGFVPRIVLASVCGFLFGQLLNAWVLVKIKERTKEKRLWVRLIGSTVVGEFADTIIFCTIAFAGIITGVDFIKYVVIGYLYKTLIEVVLLPVTYPLIGWVKRREPSYATYVPQ